MTQFSDLGIKATVAAVVTQGESMSEIENVNESPAVEPEAADPAEAADAAAEAVEEEAPADEVNADGHPVFAGELFGGADAGQAVHFTESEGLGFGPDDEAPAAEAGEGEV